ncbi:MAG TPA: ATP synthase F1 subunit delta [Bryobacteraceae bacterium]|nr:ATP synthase F1 subunit delta [Bryobacteraceae bacterium]
MRLSAVASRYATALAEVVTSGSSPLRPEDAVGQLLAFEDLMRSSAELHNALTTPAVPASRKKAVVGKLADLLKLGQITRNFLFVLIDHRRIESLPEIIQSFEQAVDERLGFARVEIASPRELTEAQRAALNGQLERLTGKRIRMRCTVDESLIGGIVARIGSTVYDGSLRGQLASLESRLRAES